MSWALLVTNEDRLDLPEGTWILGRSAECDFLTIADPSVSRRHIRVRARAETLEIEDLGSRNGTFVNGERVVTPTRLSPGDRLQCGDVEFQVHFVPVSGPFEGGENLAPDDVRFLSRRRRLALLGLLIAVLLPAALLLPHLRARPADVSQVEAPDRAGAQPPLPEPVPNGRQLFAQHCASCHGATGKGGPGPRLAGTSHSHGLVEITTTIETGAPPEMPPFGERLGRGEVLAVAQYVHTLMGKPSGEDHRH